MPYVLCCAVSIVRYGLRLKNRSNVTGPDFIPLEVIKFASNVIDSHLYNIIIKGLEKSKYSEEPKAALVGPVFKKNERIYKPVSILNGIDKIYERRIHNSLSSLLLLLTLFTVKKNSSYYTKK